MALADVPGSAVNEARKRLGGEGEHTAHERDLSEIDAGQDLVAEVVQHHRQLNVLVNAAGILCISPFLDLSADDWDRTFAVNARGSIFLAQACARQFVSQEQGGRIILFASIIARSIVRPNNLAYCASKAAVVQAARCMALELAPHGVTVNVISPGSTSTEMLVDVQARGDPEALRSVIAGNAAEWRLGIPLGRLAEPRDQAAMALYLAGEGGRHITGQELIIDGGQTVV